MATKVKSVKSVLAEFEAAFAEFKNESALEIPVTGRQEYLKGCDYSREYATVLARNPFFDQGFAEGRRFSQDWFHKNR